MQFAETFGIKQYFSRSTFLLMIWSHLRVKMLKLYWILLDKVCLVCHVTQFKNNCSKGYPEWQYLTGNEHDQIVFFYHETELWSWKIAYDDASDWNHYHDRATWSRSLPVREWYLDWQYVVMMLFCHYSIHSLVCHVTGWSILSGF